MFTVNRTQLRDELAVLTSVVSARGVIPVLSCVMLGCDGEHLTLTATDLDATVISEIPAQGNPWGGCVPAHQLAALVKLFSEDEITFTPQKTRLEVKCGSSRHLLPVTPIEQFPEITLVKTEGVPLPAELLTQMVQAVSFAMLPVSDAINPKDLKFNGLSLRSVDGKLELMATMKKVTAIAEAEIEGTIPETVIPAVAVRTLSLLGGETVVMAVDSNQVEFTSGPRTLLVRPYMETFPAWRQFLPEFKYEIAFDKAAFSTGLRRAMVTMGVDNAVGYEPLRLTFTKEQVVIESRGSDRGKSEEPVTVTSNLNGDPFAIGIVGSQLLQVLRGEQVNLALAAPDAPMMFRQMNEQFMLSYIVMPTSLRAWS